MLGGPRAISSMSAVIPGEPGTVSISSMSTLTPRGPWIVSSNTMDTDSALAQFLFRHSGEKNQFLFQGILQLHVLGERHSQNQSASKIVSVPADTGHFASHPYPLTAQDRVDAIPWRLAPN